MTDLLVFVYGTLKRDYCNHTLLEPSEYFGCFKTPPCFTMFDLGSYPAVVIGGITSISGEIYRVSNDAMDVLDKLEGYPSFYNRIQIDTPYGPAWMYVMVEHVVGKPMVMSGIWPLRYSF